MDRYGLGFNAIKITENYGERMKRLLLFESLYELKAKTTKDRSGKVIDFFSLGLLSLLFFFENMLGKNKKAGVQELGEFLYNLNREEYDLGESDFEAIARKIVEQFRPTGGKGVCSSFYNWESRKSESAKYSFLKASKSDSALNKQYYTLDESGLELIFISKEYFSEFQISVNQLLLRKQLEKGEFVNALRQIDEMMVEVESLGSRIDGVKRDVQRNIVSDSTIDRYEKLIDDINTRLKIEDEEFKELSLFVIEIKDNLAYGIDGEEDREVYNHLVKIQNELEQVHTKHRKLLKDSINLKQVTLEAIRDSFYHNGLDAFNLEKELVSRLFASPLPLKSARTLVKPFLGMQRIQEWSPMTVFAPQIIKKKAEQKSSLEFLGAKMESENQGDLKAKRDTFRRIVNIVLEELDEGGQVTLRKLVNRMESLESEANILEDGLFYNFFIVLHQKSPIEIGSKRTREESAIGYAIDPLRGRYRAIEVKELRDTVFVKDRFKITDMLLRLEAY